MGYFQFITTALRDYKKVAAILPSSRFVGRKVAELLPPNAEIVVEYGPGTGAITLPVLKRLSSRSRVIAIEQNPEFVAILQSYADKRLQVIRGNVLRINEYDKPINIDEADVIIASIPFSYLKPRERRDLIESTYNLLKPGGAFILCQVSPLMFPHLRRRFSSVRLLVEPFNLPPVFIMTAYK